jgi:uncharacterized protein (DUF433 family)
MFDEGQFDRITQDPRIMAGRPCIWGLRVTVSMILSQLGAGQTIDSLLEDFPYLQRDDVLEAIRYGAWLASGREVELKSA